MMLNVARIAHLLMEKIGRENIISIAVLALLTLLIYTIDRRNFEKEGIMLLRRTKRGLRFIEQQAEKHKNLFQFFGDLSIFISLGLLGSRVVIKDGRRMKILALIGAIISFFLALLFYHAGVQVYRYAYIPLFFFGGVVTIAPTYLLINLISALLKPLSAAPSVQLVLPIKTTKAPIFYVPLPYWITAILVIVVVHEFAHALVARAHGIRVKSIGYGFLAIIPLGFAEPDEEQLKKAQKRKKLAVYGAGSMSNFTFAVIFALIMTLLTYVAGLIFQPAGIIYTSTINGTYAHSVIPPGGTLTAINGTPINTISDLKEVLSKFEPNDTVVLTVNHCNYTVKLSPHPENRSMAFIGIAGIKTNITVKQEVREVIGERIPYILLSLITLLNFLAMLNLGIGVANLLPIRPLDGGLMLYELMENKRRKRAFRVIEMMTLVLLILNLVLPPILKYLLK